MTQIKKYLHNQLQQYIDANELFTQQDKLLVTVSGGVDSMVLLFALQRLEFNIAVAHCNFNLRGNDADQDEAFVKDFCLQHHIPFFVTHFDTLAFAEKHKISTQMAARELRYNWFQEIADEHQFNYILTAHHADDQVETFLMNMIRGTGLKGLTGISAKNKNIIRPLLFAPKEEIIAYANAHHLPFRNDKSNDDTKYKRNFIRHEVIPTLEQINPNISQTILEEVNTFQSIYTFYQQSIQRLKTELLHLHETEDAYKISILEVAGRNIEAPILFELLRDFGFNMDQVNDLYKALNEQSGKQFFSPTHTILIDRAFIILRAHQEVQKTTITIFEEDILFSTFSALNVEVLTTFDISSIKKEKNKNIAYFDYDALDFPLIYRNWEMGDKMQPLGMQGYKKVSDILIDNKIDLQSKQNTFVLTGNNTIYWLCGIRQSDKTKITASTKRVLKVSLK